MDRAVNVNGWLIAWSLMLFVLKLFFAVVLILIIWIAGHFHGWVKAKRYYEVPDGFDNW